MSDEIRDLAQAVLARYRAQKLTVAPAESCTGGLVAAALTDIAGSSDVVERGFVTYSNAAKTEMLGVLPALIERWEPAPDFRSNKKGCNSGILSGFLVGSNREFNG